MVKLHDLPAEQQELFNGPGCSDEKEWKAWMSKAACDAHHHNKMGENKQEREHPQRRLPGKVPTGGSGFQGQIPGAVPTASHLAESLRLSVCSYMQFILLLKDIKNACILLREGCWKGGLPGATSWWTTRSQLLKAKKAIYGFSKAARLFWLALKDLRVNQELKGILDLEGGVASDYFDKAFARSSKALEFATNHVKNFIFRGREVKQHDDGSIDVSMANYALNMKKLHISNERKKQLEAKLTDEEKKQLDRAAAAV